jgi:hypothetical protein
MKYYIQCVILITLVTCIAVFGQRRTMSQEGHERPRPQRLEKFKMIRLVEVLKLNEEDAVRIAAKQSAHEDTLHELMKSRNEAIDDIEAAVRSDGEKKNLQNSIDEVLNVDRKIFAERQRFQEEMRKFLSPEQFGKFMVFERNFGRNVRDAMEEMHKGRGNGSE